MKLTKSLNYARKAFVSHWRSNQPLEKMGSSYFIPINALSKQKFNANRALIYFTSIPEVNTILSKRATAFSQMHIEAVSKETGKPYTNNPNLVKVLRQPNWFQSTPELLRQASIFHDLFGNELHYFVAPVGMKRSTKHWFALPSNLVDIKAKYTDDKPYFMQADKPELTYKVKWGNKEFPLFADNVLHINGNRANVNDKTWVTGESKLESLSEPCDNLIAAYEARNVLIVNRGALGMISPDSKDVAGAIPFSETEREEIQKQYRSAYGLGRNKWQMIISKNASKYTQIAIDASKLQLFDEVAMDTKKICEAYGFPYRLLASEKTGNLAGSDISELQSVWYQNSIIPETLEKIAMLNQYFETEKQSWHIVANYDHLPFLAEDKKQRADTLKTVVEYLDKLLAQQIITKEQYITELKYHGFKFEK